MTQAVQSPGRILVVDDQPANLRVVGALLSRSGYEVLTAGNAQDALVLALEHTPDLLLLDMLMPGMDGFGLLAEIKQHPPLQAVPTVFLTAAHDLKNPLSSVLVASDVLLQGGCRPERVPRYLEMIHASADDALGYIRRYLESQAEAIALRRRQEQSRVAVPLREVHDWIVERYELQLEQRGMRVVSSLPDPCGVVAIDALVLRQVAENLVTNAMKYAHGGGELALDVRPGAPGYWQLRVQDRGAGIPARQQRELFKPFVRLRDDGDTTSSGLGLSLARQIIGNAGGQLWYEDREGGGARFVIELPEASG